MKIKFIILVFIFGSMSIAAQSNELIIELKGIIYRFKNTGC